MFGLMIGISMILNVLEVDFFLDFLSPPKKPQRIRLIFTN
ncbi:putative membrane protein [Candidatus Phytoplasma solani]